MDAVSETVESKDVLMKKIESEDMLIEILVLLPPKSIFRFMCVSRRWRNIIMHPFFVQSYSAAAARRRSGGGRLLAFFHGTTILHRCSILTPGRRNTIKYVPGSLGYFINSSNGLILCGREARRQYYVVNPVTGKHILLPPPPSQNPDNFISIGLLCEENTNELAPSYTVVQARLPHLWLQCNALYIDTYTSRTGEWSGPRKLIATDFFSPFLWQRHQVVANGCFHWHLSRRTIAVYDPNDRENHLQLISKPHYYGLYLDDRIVSYAMTRSADDVLWFGYTPGRKRMQLFMLPKGEDGRYKRKTSINHDEWILMHEIELDSIGGMVQSAMPWMKITIALETFVPSSNLQDRVVAVLRREGNVFLYNMESKSVERVRYHGFYTRGFDRSHLSPYVESSFLSSYAL